MAQWVALVIKYPSDTHLPHPEQGWNSILLACVRVCVCVCVCGGGGVLANIPLWRVTQFTLPER